MSQKVLIAPLHWGLGHASRCVPLVRQQLEQGKEVVIAARGGQKQLLQEHFPEINFIDLPFMEITYPADGNMVRHFAMNGPRLMYSILREHRMLQKLVKKEGFDLVISDARFGLWTRHARCVFVSHQIHIKSPVMEGWINALNRWVMKQYDEVWIPDYEQAPGLAGDLSHPTQLPENARYIGPLSRFGTGSDPNVLVPEQVKHWKAVAIVSGPEPQRSMFEAEIVRQYVESDESLLLLRGRPETPEERNIGNIRIVNHLPDRELLHELARAEVVIARSGYSTIMDMHVLGMKCELYPTPGQTEQEYLAKLHGHNK